MKPSPSKVMIYALVDPRNGRRYYVGSTTRGAARLREHAGVSNLRTCRNPDKRRWIESLPKRAARLPFDVETLEVFESRDELWALRDGQYPEEVWRQKLIEAGEPLTNLVAATPMIVGPKGDRHPFRLHPEKAARGARHGSKTHPERWLRGAAWHEAHDGTLPTGDRNPSRLRPERLVRGELWHRRHDKTTPRGKDAFPSRHPERMAHGERNANAKLNTEKVRELRRRGVDESAEKLAAEFQLSPSTIYRILARITWKQVA